jgi:anti-anti-sigma factor
MGPHMTIAITKPFTMPASNAATRRADYTVDCGGAQVRAHWRHLATVVTIRGEIDAVNADQVGEHVRRFVLGTDPVVLDMSGVSYFGPAGISLLHTVDEECRAAAVEWTLVPSPAMVELLGEGGAEHDGGAIFPIARSTHAALRGRADAIADRRQLVLSLIRTTN